MFTARGVSLSIPDLMRLWSKLKSPSTPLAMKYHILAIALCLILSGCGGKLTSNNFERITTGMSLNQVENVLGEGQEIASSGKLSTYQWTEKSLLGAKIVSITFQDGKSVSKASAGF